MNAMSEAYRATENLVIDLKGLVQALHDVADNIPGLVVVHPSVSGFWAVLNSIEDLADRIERAHEAEFNAGDQTDEERAFRHKLDKLSREQAARFLEAAREEGLLGQSGGAA